MHLYRRLLRGRASLLCVRRTEAQVQTRVCRASTCFLKDAGMRKLHTSARKRQDRIRAEWSKQTCKAISTNSEYSSPEGFDLVTRDDETIAAIVTGPGHQGAVSIVRVSGSDACNLAARVFRPGGQFKFDWRPISHRLYYGTVVDQDEVVVDEVLLLAMLAPRSYTCEDVIELHTHGGGLCARRVLQCCVEAGARPARQGEFTLRAFLNGRLDLSQAESVLQLIQSRTVGAADSALAGLQGGIGVMVGSIRQQCVDVLAELEARLDFDEDMPDMDLTDLRQKITRVQEEIEEALRTARQGQLLRQGLQVAIVGRPNVGKSSLLNAWTRTNRAIVTDIAGTTRDVVEADLVVGGVPLTLLDTAGIRESKDLVEKMGVERSSAAAVNADVVIMVVDAVKGWTSEDMDIFRSLWGDGPGTSRCRVKGLALLVANKVDLTGTSPAPAVQLPLVCREVFSRVVQTSALTRQGLDQLEEALLEMAGAPQLSQGGVSWAVNERQAEALVRAHEALMRVDQSVAEQLPIDFWTIDLRSAVVALGEVSGDEVTEEVLDSVFSKFCIGK